MNIITPQVGGIRISVNGFKGAIQFVYLGTLSNDQIVIITNKAIDGVGIRDVESNFPDFVVVDQINPIDYEWDQMTDKEDIFWGIHGGICDLREYQLRPDQGPHLWKSSSKGIPTVFSCGEAEEQAILQGLGEGGVVLLRPQSINGSVLSYFGPGGGFSSDWSCKEVNSVKAIKIGTWGGRRDVNRKIWDVELHLGLNDSQCPRCTLVQAVFNESSKAGPSRSNLGSDSGIKRPFNCLRRRSSDKEGGSHPSQRVRRDDSDESSSEGSGQE